MMPAKNNANIDETKDFDLDAKENEDEFEDEEEEESEEDDLALEDEDDAIIERIEYEDENIELTPEIIAEEFGYSPRYNWQKLSDDDFQKYKEIIMLSEEEIDTYSWKRLKQWLKWTYAINCLICGKLELFEEITLGILAAKRPQPEMCYGDLQIELVRFYAEQEKWEQADNMLESFIQRFPKEKSVYSRVKALLHISKGELTEGKQILDKIARADTESGQTSFEIGTTLLSLGHDELANTYLERARLLAKMHKNFEMLSDIDKAKSQYAN